MRTEFSNALAEAVDRPNPIDRIDLIKKAVAGEIRAADPAVRIRMTDYFNHGFAPDIVLRWPQEDRERLLFVRANSSVDWLLSDLPAITGHHPLVFTLEDFSTESGSEPVRGQLKAAAAATNTWVTDPSGIGALSSVRTQNPVLGLLSQALVRGGRGVADGSDVGTLTSSTANGFSAASKQGADATRTAVTAISSNLDEVQSGRLNRVLRAVWEGNGGASSLFPGPSDVGALTDDDLSYLLSAQIGATEEFWRRIGRSVTTLQLGRLRLDDPSVSLDSLVSANLDRLQAKGLRVLTEPHQLGESESVPRWMVGRGCLALRGLNWTAYVAGRRVEELPPAEEASPADIDLLKDRAPRRLGSVTRVQFGRGDRAVTYESRDGLDILQDPELAKVSDDVAGSTVEAVSATISGGGSVRIDFRERSATGATSSSFQLGSLVGSTVPLLVELTDDEAQSLETKAEGDFGPVPLPGMEF